jgi:predicted ATP-dependent serine protease
MSDSTTGDNKWQDLWKDINNNGNERWKDGEKFDFDSKHLSLLYAVGALKQDDNASAQQIFVPMAGDCRFVKTAADVGFGVSALEFVESAIDNLKARFEDADTDNQSLKFETKTLNETQLKTLKVRRRNLYMCV